MSIKAPYSYLYDMLHAMKEQDNKRIRQTAWAFVTDSLMTMACLLYTPRTIAGASIYFAGKFCEVEYKSVQGMKWWEWVGCRVEDLRKVNNLMATFYEGNPLRKGSDNEYKHTPEGNSLASPGIEERRELPTPNPDLREGDESVETTGRSGRAESVKRTIDELGSDDTSHSNGGIANGHVEEDSEPGRKRARMQDVSDNGNGTLVERPARNGRVSEKGEEAQEERDEAPKAAEDEEEGEVIEE
jgi:protein BUR2